MSHTAAMAAIALRLSRVNRFERSRIASKPTKLTRELPQPVLSPPPVTTAPVICENRGHERENKQQEQGSLLSRCANGL